MHDSATPGGPDAGDRRGRRPLPDRQRLRSTLERSTGLTPQALRHMPGLVVAVLDLGYTVVEVSSSLQRLPVAWPALRTETSVLEGLPPAEAGELHSRLEQAAGGRTTRWRYDDQRGATYDVEVAPITDSFASGVVGVALTARDISRAATAERDRAAALRSFEESFARAPIPQAMLDAAGTVTAVNAAFAALLGREPSAFNGTAFHDLVLPRDAPAIDRAVELTRSRPASENTAGTSQAAGARLLREDGDSVHCHVHMIGLADETLGARTIVQALDQTERDRYEADLRQVANHDSLTGLLNRRGFRERVADSLSSGRRRNEARTLLLIDIDHFKTINDLHGHAVGDAMLRDVADEIRAAIDPRDPASRIAGDEFAVLCVDGPTAARASAEQLIERVRNRAAEARAAGRPPLTVSVGIAEVDPVMDTVDEVLMRADLALYEAKAWGRDCIVEASSGVAGGAARRADHVLSALRKAIADDGFLLHAQPILDLETGRISQHEVLARLRGDEGALLTPGEFLPVAERHGLISELDSWVTHKTVELLGQHRAAGKPLPRLHVNLSSRSVDHPEILRQLEHDLRRFDVPPGHLVVELTEASKLMDLDLAKRFARELIDLGCPLALDDFGAGWGSLIHLRELPLDYVKLDGSLTRDAALDRAAVMVEGIARTARGLGVHTVAEWVDTPECLSRLRELGVDFAQGFQVGAPAPLAARTRRHVATANGAATSAPPEPTLDALTVVRPLA